MRPRFVSWPLAEDQPPPLEPAARDRGLAAPLRARWGRELEAWNAPDAVGRALALLEDPTTPVVVTGQQPGLWGGPLYSLYKAATAVALARRVGEAAGRPGVAVFWVNADDTDWDEVGWGALPRRDLTVHRHRIHPAPLGSRRWVGGARVTAPAEALAVLREWEEAPTVSGAPLPRDPGAGGPRSADPVELGESFIRFLLAQLGDAGLIPLDARWPEVRAAGESVWTRYRPRRREIRDAVVARGEELAAAGEPAPLDPEAAARGLFLMDGDLRLELDDEAWERAVETALDEGGADALAPSVLLRAPLQDLLFDPVAHVVGRMEGSYLRQLAPVYEALSITPPARVHRLHATLVPAGLVPLERTAEAVADPEAWVSREAAARIPAPARSALSDLRGNVDEGLRRLGESAAGFAADVEPLAESSRRKMEAQLGRLEDALERRARRDLYREHPLLRAAPEFLRPRRGEQDRGLSALAWPLFHGEAATERLLGLAGAHLDRLAEGTLHHFALEVPVV